MRLSAPKKGVFTISVILIILGLIGWFIPGNNDIFSFISRYSYWLTFIGGALLALGCMLKGF